VLTYLFQEESGGLTAFLDRFRRGGMGDLVNSWLGNSAPRELTMGQLEGALGGGLIEQLADKAGLSISKAKPALALLLPKLIAMLTPDGRMPSGIPAGVSSWLGGTARTVGTYRAEPVREPVAAAPTLWKWLLPLLALGALGLLWALWPTARPVTPPVATQPVPPPAAVVQAPTPPPATTAGTAEAWPVKIYFPTDSKTIGVDDSARIQRAAEYLKANPGAAVDITGFADKTGGAATNEELAKERAKAVRGALVAAGVRESRTNLVPPVSATPRGSSAEARRAEIRPKR
jgi:outer membrane protein OmpA-like peptidoglycan-associated protein